ncbi:hypothetical protein AZI87_00910 [Bdellovibrio bacteriovorus]|uniref:DNA 3'-5' helicase n=1 Tax=Bdellovibrio bacteriovorus TaxID=959 RepID=A0A161PRP2_BDEBC|nr:ATP-dependent helicase [Bdellovibrio bacteriovorus]KYG67868.1 hypothetical protein AZI87_00910 [Bdellovibrio bacteriovorus]
MVSLEKLSDKQREIVLNGAGLFVVRAAAGSGKTYTVAAKISHILDSWKEKGKGIAIISFTNTAWLEIASTLKSDFGISDLGYPHFLGTIDSFINKFIFLPFGNKVMNCQGRPKLVGEPHGPWRGRYYKDSFFDKITYSKGGELYFTSQQLRPNKSMVAATLSQKKSLIKAGFATQSDANYFSLILLRKYPWLAKSIVTRFPYFIMDEAQDTSDIQMEIIDLLIAAGLKQLMLVGDPDQAIYEWRNSKPELFVAKFNEWREASYILDESRRSSQAICNFVFKLSSLETIPNAVSEEVKDCDIEPEIISLDGMTAVQISDQFIEKCRQNGIQPDTHKIGILFRSKSFYAELDSDYSDSEQVEWTENRDLMDIAKAKYLFDNGQIQKAVLKLAFLYARRITKEDNLSKEQLHEAIDDFGKAALYKKILTLLREIPGIKEISVGDWCKGIESTVKKELDIDVSCKRKFKDLALGNLLKDDEAPSDYKGCRVSTIHKVKGETFDAALVLLKGKGVGKSYIKLIAEKTTVYQNEELRNVYVAITRPKRLLVIAVPDQKNVAAWTSVLKG